MQKISYMAIIFNGKKFAGQIEKKLVKKVAGLRKNGIVPKLVSIVIGNNPVSYLYLKKKGEAAKRVGIDFEKVEFSTTVEPQKIISFIKQANKNQKVHGIMIQLPLPKSLEIENLKLEILGAIDPSKDVDCLTPENLGLVMMGKPRFLPATVKAVMKVIIWALRSPASALIGKNIVIVGVSDIVGKPLAMHLKNYGATVTLCDEDTKNLIDFTRQADILVSATGVPNLIKGKMVKKRAIVIDVGSPKGDLDFEEVKKVASFITPVPGGVGPMTVVCLLENVLKMC